MELRWTEERVRSHLYNTKLRDYFYQDKKKAFNEIAAVLGITGKLCFLRRLRSSIETVTADATID